MYACVYYAKWLEIATEICFIHQEFVSGCLLYIITKPTFFPWIASRLYKHFSMFIE